MITVHVYDRALDPYGPRARERTMAAEAFVADHGWRLAGRWIDTGDAVLTPRCRPAFDLMLAAIGPVPVGSACVLVTDWTRLANAHAGRQYLARRILGAGAWISTITGESVHPDGRRLPHGRLTSAP